MRSRAVLGFVLLALAALAWLLVRTHDRDASPGSQVVPASGIPPEAAGADTTRGLGTADATPSTMRQAGASETRFDPLPEEPTEIVVHIVDDATGEPVLGAEVYVREVDHRLWPLEDLSDDECVPGIETAFKERGRRIESDEHGDLHLPLPLEWWAISARKDERFGEESFGFDALPEAKLRLAHEHSCRVRVRYSSGRPAGDALVELRAPNTGRFWRGRTDAKGEVEFRELSWLLGNASPEPEAWCATVKVACFEPPIRWFQTGDPPPSTIELVLQEASSLKLRIAASDGTPVPLNGNLSIEVRSAPGKASAPRMWDGAQLSVPLRHGETIVPGVVPGAWIFAQCELAGGEEFWAELLVPATDPGPTEVVLRLPERLQVVLTRLADDTGTPLVDSRLEWNSFAQVQGEAFVRAPHSDDVQTDAQGLMALVIAPADPYSNEWHYSIEPGVVPVWRGYLRTRRADRELVSDSIDFAAPGAGVVRDLGTLKLRLAAPLVRGRVTDERGRPLALVRIGLDASDCTRTDVDGKFVVYGMCPGGTVRLNLTRAGFAFPLEAPPVTFECGTSPDLALSLVRSGAIRTSVQAGKGLGRELHWVLEDGDEEPNIELSPEDGGGLLERTFSEVRPGTYRVRLDSEDFDAEPLLVVEDVIVHAGELTLDPRLLRIDASGLKAAERAASTVRDRSAIVLRPIDSQGKPVLDGRVHSQYADMGSSAAWHGGRIVVPWQDRESTLTIWSPGFLAWSGECPESSRDVRLEPAPVLQVHVELPPALQRPDWRFTVHMQDADCEWGVSDMISEMVGAELDPQGMARIECPGACEVTLELAGRILDPSTSLLGECVLLKTSGEIRVKLTPEPLEQRFELHATPEEWAALESALRAQH